MTAASNSAMLGTPMFGALCWTPVHGMRGGRAIAKGRPSLAVRGRHGRAWWGRSQDQAPLWALEAAGSKSSAACTRKATLHTRARKAIHELLSDQGDDNYVGRYSILSMTAELCFQTPIRVERNLRQGTKCFVFISGVCESDSWADATARSRPIPSRIDQQTDLAQRLRTQT
jgi:hypothetical protein